MSRKAFLLAVTIIFMLATARLTEFTRGDDKIARRPNIVFISLDNIGKDWFRCYGSQEDQTPNIDRLCYSGLKFPNFYVTPVYSGWPE